MNKKTFLLKKSTSNVEATTRNRRSQTNQGNDDQTMYVHGRQILREGSVEDGSLQ